MSPLQGPENPGGTNGFTMIEMFVVITILGFISTLALLKLGFISPSETELDQFLAFMRAEHARVLRNGGHHRAEFYPGRGSIEITDAEGDVLRQFTFQNWIIRSPGRQFVINLTFRGVSGPDIIRFSDPGGRSHDLNPHFTLGLVRDRDRK